MHWIDWLLVAASVALVLAFAVYTRRYVHDVVDFLAGGRCAGRYLLANARGQSDSGLANTMARFEVILVAGFVLQFWEKLPIPIILLLSIAGFVSYRYRETRAMTLAQFFEMRYSRGFRFYMGLLAFVAGILNYGIFPAVSARFFIYFLGLPEWISLAGLAIPTLAIIMAIYLGLTAFMVLVGGQVTMMVTDCIEGLLSHAIYILIAVAVFFIVSWSQVVDWMATAPKGLSQINPFDSDKVEDFNVWFIAMGLALRIYSTNAFQNRQGFNAAARTPHDARMSSVLMEWRLHARTLMLVALGVCALAFLNSPQLTSQSAGANHAIQSINDTYVQKQMTIPIAISYMLPIGIKGLFVALMIMGLVAGDSAHLHSWGSILMQDIILPLKTKAMSPGQHLWGLRFAVLAVVVWSFCFSMFFPQTQYIVLWWNLTGTVFTAGAGAAIIGGLYWSRGTTAAAWAAAITGSILCFIGIICGSFWSTVVAIIGPAVSSIGVTMPAKFYFNNMVSAFIAICTAATVYVVTSLLTCRAPFNLDKMLHRGIYAVEGEAPKAPRKPWYSALISFDGDFTKNDKLAAGGIFWISMLFVAISIVAAAWQVFYRWPVSWWANFWMLTAIVIPMVIAVGTLVWFGIGGLRDLRDFFAALRTLKRDTRDDGRVAGNHNLADEQTPRASGLGVSPEHSPRPAASDEDRSAQVLGRDAQATTRGTP